MASAGNRTDSAGSAGSLSGNNRNDSQGFCYQICYHARDHADRTGGHGFDIGELTGGPLLSVREVAAVLGVSTATVYALIERGEMVHVRVSNAIRVSAAVIAAYASPSRLKRKGRRQEK